MTSRMADLARRFRFNEGLLEVVSDGLSDADWRRRPGEAGGNPGLWILGHVTMVRRKIRRKLGAPVEAADWEAFFAPNQPAGDAADWPSADVLGADFRNSGEAIAERLIGLGPEDLAADFGKEFPDGSTTLDGALHFFYFHETYHLGQIGLIRRLCGQPGFK